MSATAKFISFEGGEGSGKSTLLLSLKELFFKEKINAIFSFEPGGTELGQELREILIRPRAYFSKKSEALLYAAARAQHVEALIEPALQKGEHVLVDRYIDASLAYQGVARGLGLKKIRDLNDWAVGGLYPHRSYYLDLDPSVGLARAKQRQALDRIEQEKLTFHAQIREAYQFLAQNDPHRFILIDASQSAEEVFRQVSKDLLDYLQA